MGIVSEQETVRPVETLERRDDARTVERHRLPLMNESASGHKLESFRTAQTPFACRMKQGIREQQDREGQEMTCAGYAMGETAEQ